MAKKVLIELEGQTKTLMEWCREKGTPYHLAYQRRARGWKAKDLFVERCESYVHEGADHHFYKHGLSHHRSRAYDIYHGVLQRCYNPKRKQFARYGGRGIRVCERWLGSNGFLNFVSDMGEPPTKQHSIERIDNDSHYSPENCTWLLMSLQAKNKSTNINITHNGTTDNLNGWAKRIGLDHETVRRRYKKGMTIEQIVSPIKRRNQFDPNV